MRCMASDHAQEECALHPNREMPVVHCRITGWGGHGERSRPLAIREEGEDIGDAMPIMMADVPYHSVGLSTSAQFVGGKTACRMREQ